MDQYQSSRMLRVLLSMLTRIKHGSLDLILPDGTYFSSKGPLPGPHGELHIHRDRMARRFLLGGRLGFCESYIDGDCSSPDLASFFDVILANTNRMHGRMNKRSWSNWIAKWLHKFRRNSRSGSRTNIYAHYDIGNDFYSRWLDTSMTYSSALFTEKDMSLEAAQQAKYDRIIDRLDIQPTDRVLEIGCGWGGFAQRAGERTGCFVHGITISQAQFDYASERLKMAGLMDRTKIELIDYRDVMGQYDKIVSIEMFEAVGEAYWSVYFDTLRQRLKPGGTAMLQIITIADEDFERYRTGADYIQRYIFPGGMLAPKGLLSQLAEKAGLREKEMFCFGPDYARTLDLWNDNFQKAWPNLYSEKMDERFKRTWEQYLAYCQAGFTAGTIDVCHLLLEKSH